MQLHAGDALEVRGEEVGRDRPRAQWQFRAVHDAPGLDGEVHPAVIAAERLRLASWAGADVERIAAGADHAVGPACFDEPCLGGRFIREQLNSIDERKTLAVVFTWCCLRHGAYPFRHQFTLRGRWAQWVNCDILPFRCSPGPPVGPPLWPPRVRVASERRTSVYGALTHDAHPRRRMASRRRRAQTHTIARSCGSGGARVATTSAAAAATPRCEDLPDRAARHNVDRARSGRLDGWRSRGIAMAQRRNAGATGPRGRRPPRRSATFTAWRGARPGGGCPDRQRQGRTRPLAGTSPSD